MNIFSSKLATKVVDIAAIALLGRATIFVLAIIILYGYSVGKGIQAMYSDLPNYNLTTVSYIVSGKDCYSVVDGSTNKIIYERKVRSWEHNNSGCLSSDKDSIRYIDNHFASAARGVHKSSVNVIYIIAMCLFITGLVMLLGNSETPHIASKMTHRNILALWLVLCLLLYPITFSDYTSGATITTQTNSYYVNSIFLSKDKASYVKLPPNLVGKILAADSTIEKRVSDI